MDWIQNAIFEEEMMMFTPNPKRQIYFHFNSKSVIKNALELVLGPFTSNPQQVKKFFLGGYWKIPGPPPWKFPGPDQ